MSHSYYVMTAAGTELMSVEEFLAAALRRWPEARVTGQGVVDLTAAPDVLARELYFDGSALAVDNASFDTFYDVARWFRSLVGDEHELLLTETSYGRLLQPFTESTTEDEVAQVLGG